MRLLGHKNIKNSLRYVQLLEGMGDDSYTCKVAKSLEEASKLIEVGFDYVTEVDGVKCFGRGSGCPSIRAKVC